MHYKLNVGIICGGCSDEHEISLQSATYIAQSIDKNRFAIVVLWISKKGHWYLVKNKNINFFSYYDKNQYVPVIFDHHVNQFYFCSNEKNNILKLDIVFPIIHGSYGEDGSIQGFLRMMNLPYVGSDILGSAICMNKDITKCLLRDAGLPVIAFKTILISERYNVNFYDIEKDFGLPLFIKPVDQGSSIGGSKVNNFINFNQSLDTAFSYSNKIIIEPFIMGRELECAILGNYDPISSVCGEIVLNNNNFYTYYDKYIEYDSQIIIPAMVDNLISDKIRYIAVQAFKVLRCLGMARVDLFLTKNNQIFINEVNTIPGFTKNSMYPKLWQATGLNTQLLLTKLIELACNKNKITFNL